MKKVIAMLCVIATLVGMFAFGASAYYAGFDDVAEDSYCWEAVAWGDCEGICHGYEGNVFKPNNNVTRAQAVTFLNRYNDNAEGHVAEQFEDCNDLIQDYKNAIYWALDCGITTGYTETTFRPNANITRAQAVTMLYRMAGEPVVNESCQFEDIDSNAYYYNAVIWAVASGITNGITETSFQPNGTCTRGQFVTFLYRYDQYHIEPVCQHENEELTGVYNYCETVEDEIVYYRVKTYTCKDCGETRDETIELKREPYCAHNECLSSRAYEFVTGTGSYTNYIKRTTFYTCEDCGAPVGENNYNLTMSDIWIDVSKYMDTNWLSVYCDSVYATSNSHDEIWCFGADGNALVLRAYDNVVSSGTQGGRQWIRVQDDFNHNIYIYANEVINEAYEDLSVEQSMTQEGLEYYRAIFENGEAPDGMTNDGWSTYGETTLLDLNYYQGQRTLTELSYDDVYTCWWDNVVESYHETLCVKGSGDDNIYLFGIEGVY